MPLCVSNIYIQCIYNNLFKGLWEINLISPLFFKLRMVYVLTYWIHPSCNSSLLKRLKIYKTLMGYGFNASSHYPSFAFQSRSEWSFRLPCNHLPAQLIFSERSPERLPGSSPAQPGWRGRAASTAPPAPRAAASAAPKAGTGTDTNGNQAGGNMGKRQEGREGGEEKERGGRKKKGKKKLNSQVRAGEEINGSVQEEWWREI